MSFPTDAHLGQCKHDTRKDVDDDLLIHATLDPAAKDGVATDETRDKRVIACFFVWCARGSEDVPDRFVDGGEEGEIAGDRTSLAACAGHVE